MWYLNISISDIINIFKIWYFQSSSSTTIRKKTPCHGKVQRFACYLTDSYRQIFSKYGFLKKKYIYILQITAIAVVGSISIFNSGSVPKSALQIPAIGLDLACRWKPVNAMDKRLDACTCNGAGRNFKWPWLQTKLEERSLINSEQVKIRPATAIWKPEPKQLVSTIPRWTQKKSIEKLYVYIMYNFNIILLLHLQQAKNIQKQHLSKAQTMSG